MRPPLIILLIGFFIAVASLLAPSIRADEGWVIKSFDTQVQIQNDGTLLIAETISVDFGPLQKHGIFRDIPVVYDYDKKSNRVYDLSVMSVTDQTGQRHRYEVSRQGGFVRIKIGDPNRTISGPQVYRITYRVRNALNSFDDHDELFWNIISDPGWPVRIEQATATVTLPADGVQEITCYQGPRRSLERCRSEHTARTATFETTRILPERESFTVVVALRKGIVPDPQPKLVAKPRQFPDYFEVTPLTTGGGILLGIAALVGLGRAWWAFGRDRRYTTLYYLTDKPSEETRPLLSSDPIVIEYQPPEKLRPAQMGVLLDERADTLDATATIIDLAVRGYLQITEVPHEGFFESLFGRKDWLLERTDKDDSDLLPYETVLLNGLFQDGPSVKLSDLRTKFHTYLNDAKERLYKDAVRRRWFPYRPDRVRLLWRGLGIAIVVLGSISILALGPLFGAGLLGIPLLLAGLITMLIAPWMPRRTAQGRELLRRTLGFRHYLATAEKERQRFNEQQNLFAEYLPYAIVFHCVDKWARAFRDIDTAAATRSWYSGSDGFSAVAFSSNLQGFASQVSSVATSTPGSSGGSGFGGGSGGGGGGGGGGSW